MIFVIAFLLAMSCKKAQSQVITLDENGYRDGYLVTNTEIYSWGLISVGGSIVSATQGVDPVLTATAVANSGYITSGAGYLDYDFEVNGPPLPSGTLIPMDITASATVTANGVSNAIGQLYLHIGIYGEGYAFSDYLSTGNGTNSFSFTNHEFPIQANMDYSVSEYVGASGGTGSYGTASATIDPLLTLDTNFTATNSDYTLELSPGIKNVPEPSQMGLIVLSLSALGLVFLRRRISEAKLR